MTEDISYKRLAQNEVTAREQNEKVEHKLKNVLDDTDTISFVCECSDEECKERIAITLQRFNELHSSSKHFIVTPHHEMVRVERVMEKTEHYYIVEKFIEPDTR